MARPRGSTGIYPRWSPKKLADLRWHIEVLRDLPQWDTEVVLQGKLNKSVLARLLCEQFPGEYQSKEQLRQVLSGTYLRKKPATDRRKIEQQWPRAFFGLDEDDHAKSAGQDLQGANTADNRGAVEAPRGDGNDALLEDIDGDADTVGMDNTAAPEEDVLGAPAGKDVKQTARQDRHAESSAVPQDSVRDAADSRAAVEQSSPAPDGSQGTS
jgi:hypothetical protein